MLCSPYPYVGLEAHLNLYNDVPKSSSSVLEAGTLKAIAGTDVLSPMRWAGLLKACN